MIRFAYKRVSNGANSWHIDGSISGGIVIINRLYGDVNNPAGLKQAVENLINSKKKYLRA